MTDVAWPFALAAAVLAAWDVARRLLARRDHVSQDGRIVALESRVQQLEQAEQACRQREHDSAREQGRRWDEVEQKIQGLQLGQSFGRRG